jgi:ABC-type dipeptide/oligopeptide/nickel transport system permease component
VLNSDLITAAQAKGLRMSWILAMYVLLQIRPALPQALGSVLRVSVASLPIVEYLFRPGRARCSARPSSNA